MGSDRGSQYQTVEAYHQNISALNFTAWKIPSLRSIAEELAARNVAFYFSHVQMKTKDECQVKPILVIGVGFNFLLLSSRLKLPCCWSILINSSLHFDSGSDQACQRRNVNTVSESSLETAFTSL